jgi:TolB-like protein/Flp pilus assembly protein TadD/tRNA A-37 threonylcarbamoyl transferase component Bud32
MIGQTISHYRILSKLGEGGMGVVYKAEDIKLHRFVALKFLPPSIGDDTARERFTHEAQAVSSLEHPNICSIYEIDESPAGQMFIVMPCYEGESLQQKIVRGPMKIDEAIETASQVASGLARAHEKGVIHRDIKPANIFITKDGAKIVDFGLAKLAAHTKLTKTGTTVGTTMYMSPEQARGQETDQRTDIWSLGAVLYEMLIGRPPFSGEHEAAVLYQIMNEEPQPITGVRTGVPMELERIVAKCVAKNPEERYQHADEIVVDLRRLRSSLAGSSSTRPSVLGTGVARRRSLPWPWVAVFLVVVVAAGGVVLRLRAPSKAPSGSERKMLAVLPFENLGAPEDEYFAAGITEEITSRLATIRELGVTSRTSALQYADTKKTVKEIGAELGVGYVLEGTVRWARKPGEPSKVRITPQLIRVSDDTHLWSDTYDRVMEDIFDIQSDIAQRVVEHMGLALLDKKHPAIENRATDNLEAYQAYLQARYWAGQPHFTAENWERAIQSYERAVGIDPKFALAYAGLSIAHGRLYYYLYDLSSERRERARAAVEEAARLAPDAPQVHLALGYYHLLIERDAPKALGEFELASRDLPDDADVLKAKADCFREQGRWVEAIDHYRRACELDPRNGSLWVDLAECHWWTRRYAEADEESDKALAFAPDQMWPYLTKVFNTWSWKGASSATRATLEAMPAEIRDEWVDWAWFRQCLLEGEYQEALDRLAAKSDGWIRVKISAEPVAMSAAQVYELLGDEPRARTEFETARGLLEAEVRAHPDDPRYHSALGVVYAALGQRDDAIREGTRGVELLPMTKDAVYGIPGVIALAHIYALIGDHRAAVEQLDLLLSAPSWISPVWLKIDPRWNLLRGDPEFKELLVKHATEKT